MGQVMNQGQTINCKSEKWSISKNCRLFCRQTKQIGLSIASNFFSHQLKFPCIYASLLNFAPGAIYVSQTFLVLIALNRQSQKQINDIDLLLGQLSHSVDLLLWVGVRQLALSLVH